MNTTDLIKTRYFAAGYIVSGMFGLESGGMFRFLTNGEGTGKMANSDQIAGHLKEKLKLKLGSRPIILSLTEFSCKEDADEFFREEKEQVTKSEK